MLSLAPSKCAISDKSYESKSRYLPKTRFWAKFEPKWPKFGPEIFFQPQDHQYLLDIMPVYHNQQNILEKMVENPKFGSGSFKKGIWRQK